MMEERKIPFDFLYIVKELKALRIPCMSERNSDNSWTTFTGGEDDTMIHTWGMGSTKEASLRDYVRGLKETARIMYEDEELGGASFLNLLKILISTEEELLSCLDGKTCGVF